MPPSINYTTQIIFIFFKGTMIFGDTTNQTMFGRLVFLTNSSTHYTCEAATIAYINGTGPNLRENAFLEKYAAILFISQFSDKPSSPNKWL